MNGIGFSVRNAFIFIFLFIFSQGALCSVVVSPAVIVKDFYQLYLNENSKESPELLNKYVSGKLIQSITASSECNYDSGDSLSDSEREKICSQIRECKDYKGNYICNWNGFWVESDVDYFIKSQDIYPSWEKDINAVVVSQSNSESVIEVSLGSGADPVMNLEVKMKLDKGIWKIISVTE